MAQIGGQGGTGRLREDGRADRRAGSDPVVCGEDGVSESTGHPQALRDEPTGFTLSPVVTPLQSAALIGEGGGNQWSPGPGVLSATVDQLSSPPPGATSVNTCRVEF